MSFSRRVSNRKRFAYDARTGLKVFGADRLQEDGERPGVLTLDRDDVHPQRYVSVPPADRVRYIQRTRDPASIPVHLSIGRLRLEGSGNNQYIPAPYIGLAPVNMYFLEGGISAQVEIVARDDGPIQLRGSTGGVTIRSI